MKCNSDFADESGTTCDKYAKNKYCTNTGEKGDGWDEKTYPYPISSYLNENGESPLVCPQCGCKLGNNVKLNVCIKHLVCFYTKLFFIELILIQF